MRKGTTCSQPNPIVLFRLTCYFIIKRKQTFCIGLHSSAFWIYQERVLPGSVITIPFRQRLGLTHWFPHIIFLPSHTPEKKENLVKHFSVQIQYLKLALCKLSYDKLPVARLGI